MDAPHSRGMTLRVCGAHSGYQLGLRFSRKAAMPSCASADFGSCGGGTLARISVEVGRCVARGGGLELRQRVWRAEQQRVGDLRQRGIERQRFAKLVHEPEPQRVRGLDAFARQSVAPERAVADGADHERHDAHRRHADAHLGDREEGVAGGDRDVAAADEAGAAADRAAFDHRDGRLRQAVEDRQHVA